MTADGLVRYVTYYYVCHAVLSVFVLIGVVHALQPSVLALSLSLDPLMLIAAALGIGAPNNLQATLAYSTVLTLGVMLLACVAGG